MDARNKQIPRPKHWQAFEDLCQALFKAVWNDPLAQKNGRGGQPQNGVDVWAAVDGNRSRFQGVQCKGKDEALGASVTKTELLGELAKADKFTPSLEHWVLATTAPADGELQALAREISVERERQGKFTVQVLGWADIETLLCDYPAVLEAFYPEIGTSLKTLINEMSRVGAHEAAVPPPSPTAQVQPCGASNWRRITFQGARDIGPALLGRGLGPADALACPRLPEADLAVKQLEAAFSVRIVGEPGAGKSVCAFQVASTFAAQGCEVFAWVGPQTLYEFHPGSSGNGVLLLVDDAHLIPEAQMRALEDGARNKCLVLSTHNAVDGHTSQRGAVRMDPRADIGAIAAGLLADRQATLDAVRRADNHIGDLMMDEALEERIQHAVRYASVPWQFCFVLGGGWRRANEAANAARALGADLVLAAIAIRQLASRDARPTQPEIAALLQKAGVATDELTDRLRSLASERLIVSPEDLRCPHQRLASVLLGRILQREDAAGVATIGALLNATLADESLPLGGLSVLLHELFFADDGRWRHLVNRAALLSTIDRCWKAVGPNEIAVACHVMREAMGLVEDWDAAIFEGHESTFIGWIERAANPMGHGLAGLLYAVLNKHEQRALELVRRTDAASISSLISNVDVSSVWHVAELAIPLRLGLGDPWALDVIGGIDWVRLSEFASSWPENEPIHRIIKLLQALVWPAEEQTLDLVEAFLPIARRRLIADPVEEFRALDDLLWHVLRVLDPLGTYTGKRRPSARHLRIARSLFDGVDLDAMAEKLSQAPLRMFQQVSFLFSVMRRVSQSRFRKLVEAMDWNAIGATIGDHWKHLPHDAEVLFGLASTASKSREPVASLVRRNLARMETMPPRLAYVAPDCALDFVREGKTIALARHTHVDWRFGPFVVALFAEKDAQLLPVALEPCIATLAKALSATHESWYKESAPMLEGMLAHAPQSLQNALDLVDVAGARVGWTAAKEAGAGGRKAVAVLLRAATGRSDALGALAAELSKVRLPKNPKQGRQGRRNPPS